MLAYVYLASHIHIYGKLWWRNWSIFAEAMRNIIRHNEEKEKKQRNVDNDFDEEDCSLQEILEAKFDELFGTAQNDEENS